MKVDEPSQVIKIGLLLLMFSLLLVACSGQASVASEVTATAPPVAYGASLSEWEAAMQANADQPEGSNAEATLPPPIVSTEVEAAVEQVNPDQHEGGNGAVIVQETPDDGIPPTPEIAVDTAPQSTATVAAPTIEADSQTQTTAQVSGFQELTWEQLVPPEFSPDAIMARYQEELAQFEDGDPGAREVYDQMVEEFNNAPINQELDNTMMRLPGFIAPLEYSGDLITEFLLVPYFGACIHVPPPPPNQTVLVKMAEGTGIATEDSFEPVWVLGLLTAQSTTTELADAGYSVESALVEPYAYGP
jgi:hypothetical protein